MVVSTDVSTRFLCADRRTTHVVPVAGSTVELLVLSCVSVDFFFLFFCFLWAEGRASGAEASGSCVTSGDSVEGDILRRRKFELSERGQSCLARSISHFLFSCPS